MFMRLSRLRPPVARLFGQSISRSTVVGKHLTYAWEALVVWFTHYGPRTTTPVMIPTEIGLHTRAIINYAAKTSNRSGPVSWAPPKMRRPVLPKHSGSEGNYLTKYFSYFFCMLSETGLQKHNTSLLPIFLQMYGNNTR